MHTETSRETLNSTSASQAGASSKRRIPIFTLLMLALLAQYLWIAGHLMAGGPPGQFGCTNFHSDGLSACSFAEMLVNALIGLLLANLVSFGIPTFVTAGFLVLGLLAYRRLS